MTQEPIREYTGRWGEKSKPLHAEGNSKSQMVMWSKPEASNSTTRSRTSFYPPSQQFQQVNLVVPMRQSAWWKILRLIFTYKRDISANDQSRFFFIPDPSWVRLPTMQCVQWRSLSNDTCCYGKRDHASPRRPICKQPTCPLIQLRPGKHPDRMTISDHTEPRSRTPWTHNWPQHCSGSNDTGSSWTS